MKKICTLAAVLACLTPFESSADSRGSLDASVDRAVEGCDVFTVDSRTEVVSQSAESDSYVPYLQEFISGKSALSAGRDVSGRIVLSVDPEKVCGAEGFDISVTSSGIAITGHDRAGVFYGIQHLLRLLPPSVYCREGLGMPVTLGCGDFCTAPQKRYRGVMIDVARAFVDADKLKRQIDLMSMHNINVLHLHLTDNEGWRLEIKSHPELASVGGFRGGDSPIAPQYGRWNERYGGYYTQEQMKDIVSYAAFRNVTIIPEIDLPGHSHAVARVFPEILCNFKPDLTKTAGYDTRNVWCVSREENYRLLDDIFTEIAEIFPSPYIHIGGDEVGMGNWLSCPGCSALMKEKGFTDVKQLGNCFMTRVMDIVRSKGKSPLAWWDKDVTTDSLPKDCIVDAWQDIATCRDALSKGYRTVFMSAWHFYFDMRQGAYDQGQTWGGAIDYMRVYRSRPEALGVTGQEAANIIGFEGAFWAETHMQNNPDSPDYLDYMLYPRVAALGALAWGVDLSPEDFRREIESRHYARMSAMGIAFRLPEPSVKWENGVLTASASDGAEVFYRKNGGKPKPYTSAIKTSRPEHYLFFSRSGSGRSSEVIAPQCYEQIYPSLHLSSTLPDDGWRPASGVESYKTETHFASAPHAGDSVLFTFDDPVSCRKIEVVTGDAHFASGGFSEGYVELSYDGKHFSKAADLSFSRASVYPKKAVKALRLVCTRDGNSRDLTIIQPLQVWTSSHTGPECVLIGDSITWQWLEYRPDFFESNGFVGAGISGQVSAQILARFDEDVVARDPKNVSILCGINDIAQNQGYISNEDIAKNIAAMIDKAQAAKIRVILWSVLPSDVLRWRKDIDPAPLVKDLNVKLKAIAEEKGVTYVDFYSAHVTETGGLPADLTADGVHVTAACYELMEQALLKRLGKK